MIILGRESKIFGWRKWWFWHLLQHLFLSFFLFLLLLLFSIFGLIIYMKLYMGLMNFYMGLMNMGVLLIFWVWHGCTVDEYGCVVDEFADIGRGQSSKGIVRTFSLHSFPPDLGGKKLVGPEENFLLSFPSSLFSFGSQTVENTVFHTIFHPLFSILPIIPPTKHSVSVQRRCGDGERAKNSSGLDVEAKKKKKKLTLLLSTAMWERVREEDMWV